MILFFLSDSPFREKIFSLPLAISLVLPSILLSPFSPSHPSVLSCICSYFLFLSSLPRPPQPSLPTVGKWRVARVPAWTGTPLGAAAHPGPNSLAPVAMWTCSRPLPRQQHLPRSPPSTSIRKMDTTRPLRVHSRDRLSITDR